MSEMIKVKNRNSAWTCYSIPDKNVTRSFAPGEEKIVELDEIKQLQWREGSRYLLENCLLINDKSALEALNMEDVEPEYFYTEAEIKELLSNGTLAQLEDCLNFAPEGVIELIKDIAVKTELPDTRKRKMISEKTGLNIDNAIMVNTIMNEETEAPVEEKKVTRKAAPIETKKAEPTRKASPIKNKYTVVEK